MGAVQQYYYGANLFSFPNVLTTEDNQVTAGYQNKNKIQSTAVWISKTEVFPRLLADRTCG